MSVLATFGLFSLVIGLLLLLCPTGAGRRVVTLAAGASAAVVLLSAVAGISGDGIARRLRSYAASFAAADEALTAETEKSILKEQTLAYIEARAASLGFPCTVRAVFGEGPEGYGIRFLTLVGENGEENGEVLSIISRELGIVGGE